MGGSDVVTCELINIYCSFYGDAGHTCSCLFLGILIVNSSVVVGGTFGYNLLFHFVLVMGPPGCNVATIIYLVVTPHKFNFILSSDSASLASTIPRHRWRNIVHIWSVSG